MEKKLQMVRINVCPKCNSPDIRQESSLGGWLMPESWSCSKCGYRGILVKEIEVKK